MIVIEPPSSDAGSGVFAQLRRPVLSRFSKRAQKAAGVSGEVTVLLAGDARLKELNRSFRRKNKATDVLSFPAPPNVEGVAGDLAVSVETAQRQADEHGHALEDELRILILHGMLHLAGHDHETDSGEMRALEAELRGRLKLPLGLIERTQTPARPQTARPQTARSQTQPPLPKRTTRKGGAAGAPAAPRAKALSGTRTPAKRSAR